MELVGVGTGKDEISSSSPLTKPTVELIGAGFDAKFGFDL